MSLKLVRLDDRLIHGQVVVGWCNALAVEHILLIDDEVAVNDWEQELYRMGVPPEMDIEFCSLADAGSALNRCATSAERNIVLVGDVESLVKTCEASDVVQRVNVGGVHERDGRSKRLSYVFLTDAEAAALRRLNESGIQVTARDVPSNKPVPVSDFT